MSYVLRFSQTAGQQDTDFKSAVATSWLWLVYFLRLLATLARGLHSLSLSLFSAKLFIFPQLLVGVRRVGCRAQKRRPAEWLYGEGPGCDQSSGRDLLQTFGEAATAGKLQGKPQLSICSLDNRLANTNITYANNSVAVSEGTSFGQYTLCFLCLTSNWQRLIALSWTPAGHQQSSDAVTSTAWVLNKLGNKQLCRHSLTHSEMHCGIMSCHIIHNPIQQTLRLPLWPHFIFNLYLVSSESMFKSFMAMFYLTAFARHTNHDAVAKHCRKVKQLRRKQTDGRREGENSALSVLT